MSRYLNLARQAPSGQEAPPTPEENNSPNAAKRGKRGKSPQQDAQPEQNLGPLTESGGSVGADEERIPKKIVLAPPGEPDPRALTAEEAESVGLNPRFTWMRVACRGEVEATTPLLDWDGTLPATCRHPGLCPRLGPCPHALTLCVSNPKGE